MNHTTPTVTRAHRTVFGRAAALTPAALALLASGALAPLSAQTAPASEPVKLEAFVSTGTRFNDRTVAESPVPIDIITAAEINTHRADYSLPFPGLPDGKGTLARHAGAMRVPEAAGGLGLGAFDACVLMEEAGRTLASGPLAEALDRTTFSNLRILATDIDEQEVAVGGCAVDVGQRGEALAQRIELLLDAGQLTACRKDPAALVGRSVSQWVDGLGLDRRRIVLILTAMFVVLNFVFTAITIELGPAFYGYGFAFALLIVVMMGGGW